MKRNLRIPSNYNKNDIFPTIARVYFMKGKLLMKVEDDGALLCIINVSLPDDPQLISRINSLIEKRKVNKVSTGKITINVYQNEDGAKHVYAGIIIVKNAAVVGAVLNPFSAKVFNLFLKAIKGTDYETKFNIPENFFETIDEGEYNSNIPDIQELVE